MTLSIHHWKGVPPTLLLTWYGDESQLGHCWVRLLPWPQEPSPDPASERDVYQTRGTYGSAACRVSLVIDKTRFNWQIAKLICQIHYQMAKTPGLWCRGREGWAVYFHRNAEWKCPDGKWARKAGCFPLPILTHSCSFARAIRRLFIF